MLKRKSQDLREPDRLETMNRSVDDRINPDKAWVHIEKRLEKLEGSRAEAQLERTVEEVEAMLNAFVDTLPALITERQRNIQNADEKVSQLERLSKQNQRPANYLQLDAQFRREIAILAGERSALVDKMRISLPALPARIFDENFKKQNRKGNVGLRRLSVFAHDGKPQPLRIECLFYKSGGESLISGIKLDIRRNYYREGERPDVSFTQVPSPTEMAAMQEKSKEEALERIARAMQELTRREIPKPATGTEAQPTTDIRKIT